MLDVFSPERIIIVVILIIFLLLLRRRGKRENLEKPLVPSKKVSKIKLLFLVLGSVVVASGLIYLFDPLVSLIFFLFSIGILFLLIYAGLYNVETAHRGILEYFGERIEKEEVLWDRYVRDYGKFIAKTLYKISPPCILPEGLSWLIPVMHTHIPVEVKEITTSLRVDNVYTQDEVEMYANWVFVAYQWNVYKAPQVIDPYERIYAKIREGTRGAAQVPNQYPRNYKEAMGASDKFSRIVMAMLMDQPIPRYSDEEVEKYKADTTLTPEQKRKIIPGQPKLEVHMSDVEKENKKKAEGLRVQLKEGKDEYTDERTGLRIVRLYCESVVPNDKFKEKLQEATSEFPERMKDVIDMETLGLAVNAFYRMSLYKNYDELSPEKKIEADKNIQEKVNTLLSDEKKLTNFLASLRSERNKANEEIRRIFIDSSDPIATILAPLFNLADRVAGGKQSKGGSK
ncbi:hypothetical protein A2755_03200 [Candidatus Wolfebacteria bacterium RIFCSPHIGHO2_01_FULL_48_22]|uniref:Band 7 domain-containing protein n=2 Tax=Candidatus Wolfeibacteriota TaxID=1752735 RepID=A0A1F8DPI7_9BACT|nr:MAG: hypothetical protein A2755_03200 [Candidatus Wolfebacteria bacterium RIFCSPHIGHO2_01_FULL_48_22]OGM92036.1 MAG: hypothetical protein A2935_01690 [Candidatus Wolfebacteria bacterium RIFCSPLOWO2_01_FULL_47_17b]